MSWFESLKLAADSLWSNRLRSSLTMIGLIIGISSVILIVAFGVGAQRFVNQQFEGLGTDVVALFDGGPTGPRTEGRQPLTLDDAIAIQTQAATVKNIAPVISGQGQVVRGSRNIQAEINGTPASLEEVFKISYVKGRYFTRAEIEGHSRVVIIGEELSKQLFQYEDPIGKTIMVSNQPMVVVGVTRPKGLGSWINLKQGLMVPLSLAVDSLLESESPFGKKITFLIMQAKPSATMQEVTFEARNLMRLRHDVTEEEDFIIYDLKSSVDLVNNVVLAVTIVLGLTAAVSLVVSGVGITNIMLASVLERTREIGLRKALGASEEVILTQFVIEAVLLSLLGGILGVLLGGLGAVAAGKVSPVQPEITTWSILLAVGISAGTGVLFGIAPAQRAAQLDPIVALRSD
jgi:putative ABC transport system permease protein